VVVVDQAHTGKATLAGAGIVCPWVSTMDDGPLLDLYMTSAAVYESIVGQVSRRTGTDLGVDIGYRKVGALVVTPLAAHLDAAEERLARRSVGRPEVGEVRRIDNAEARRLFPPLRADADAIHVSGGARVDGRLLARALLDASGASRVVSPALADLMVSGGRVTGVRVGDETIAADAVAAATGAWTPALLEAVVPAEVDVEPQKGQILHLGLDADTSRWPVVFPLGDHYLVAFDDGRVVVGGTRETGSGFDTRVTADGHASLLDTALTVAPGLADATILETRVGLRPLANDLPTLGPVPGVEGLYVGTGLGPAGLTIGPYFGGLLAGLALGHDPADSPKLATPRSRP